MNRILIVGRANTISAQLAAIAPLARIPTISEVRRSTSRDNIAPSASYQAAGIPQPAADLEGWE